MYLSRLVVQNYRSIQILDLKFCKGKNVIVGKNNAGKSNIIKAIDLVLGESAPTYDKSENITENDFYGGDTNQPIIIYCELIRDQSEELNFEEINKCFGLKINAKWADDGTKGKKQIRYGISQETEKLFKNIGSLLNIDENSEGIVTDYVDSKLRYQVNFESFLSDKYHFSFAFRARYNNGRLEKQLRSFFATTPEQGWVMAFSAHVRNELLQSAIIPSFRDPQNQLRISNWGWYGKLLKGSVDPDNEKLKAAFQQVKEASDEVFEKLKEKINDSKVKVAFPNTEISFQFNPDTKQDVHKSALIYVDDGFRSQLQDKGSGIQSAIIIGLFHFYCREILKAPSSLLTIEEPELYLHPHGRRVVSSRLDDFLEGNKNQVIVTTHSSEFINTAQDNINIIVTKKNTDTGTVAANVFFDKPEEKQILIKNQNTEMFFADHVVLVEGGGDKYILEEVAKWYGNQDSELGKNWLNDRNISVVATIGKSEFWKYATKLRELGIEYSILSDFDFFRSGLCNYLLKNSLNDIKDIYNSLNSKVSQENSECENVSDLNGNQKLADEVGHFFTDLQARAAVFIQDCGQLEDTYTQEARDYLITNSYGSGSDKKEQAALALVTLIVTGQKNVTQLINTEKFKIFLDHLSTSTNNSPPASEQVEITIPEIEIPELEQLNANSDIPF